ncbi:MAG TPA: exodeoxyribonuclease VII small subunit [Anaerolineales bacterium]|jgi:exodeoxyribonuclease VII small subunit|nr:exodeoxyribonuclease VII small subunit [Anaerolineales bacterium]
MNKDLDLDALSYEQAFEELKTVIDQLEAGDKPLEETLSLYERGQTLFRHCTTLLEQAELKVQQLNADGAVDDFED